MIQWHEPQLIWCLVWKGYFKKRDCVINVCLFCFPKCFLILYETKLCHWCVCNFIANTKFSCVFKGSNMQSRLTFLTKESLKVKNDQRSKFSNLSNWKEEAWKNQGFYSTLFWFSSTNFVLWVHSQCMKCNVNLVKWIKKGELLRMGLFSWYRKDFHSGMSPY